LNSATLARVAIIPFAGWLGAAGCHSDRTDQGSSTQRGPFARTVAPPPATDVTVQRHPRKAWFEAEFEGTLRGVRGDGHRVVFIAIEPCDPERLESTKTVATAFLGPESKEGSFATEAAAHDGSGFYACAFALDDEDHVVGFGQYEKNPIAVRANDDPEVEIEDVDISLAPTRPRQLPMGRYHGASR
jgi:hypothetical protein